MVRRHEDLCRRVAVGGRWNESFVCRVLNRLSQPCKVKLVGVPLAMNLGHDVLVVVVPAVVCCVVVSCGGRVKCIFNTEKHRFICYLIELFCIVVNSIKSEKVCDLRALLILS